MANVSTTETFPMSSFTRADVEAERTLRLAIPGAISSTITEAGENWVLTTVLPGADDAPPIAAAPTHPVAPPPAGPAGAPAPQPSPSFVLGGLSTRFETGGRGSTTVSGGVGDAGGVSYGTYQMTSQPNGGTVARFVAQPDFPFRNDFASLAPGSAAFSAKWKDIATRFPANFKDAEHEFIKRTHYDPLCTKIATDDGVDIAHCSHAMQDVIWSTAVQHGPNATIVHLAFGQMRAAGTFSPAAPQFDRNAINAIYDERGRKDANGVLVHFSKNSPAVQNSVARRSSKRRQTP